MTRSMKSTGLTGITGAADTNFILKRKRSGKGATLLASSRDVEYQELALRFTDKQVCDTIIKLLEQWQRRRERDRDAR